MYEFATPHRSLWGASPVFLCAYLLSICLILKNRKTNENVYHTFIPLVLLGLALVYFPGFEKLVGRVFYNLRMFRRFRWLFLIVPVIAVGLTYVVLQMEKKRRQMVIISCLLLMIVLWQQPWRRLWDSSINRYYKIPEECVEISDYIYEKNAGRFDGDELSYVTVVVQDEEETNGSNEDGNRRIGWGIRQYFSPVYVRFFVITPETSDFIKEHINADYVICTKTKEIRDAFEQVGFQLVYEYDSFCFYEMK